MQKREEPKKKGIHLPDILALGLFIAIFAAVVAVAQYWSGPLRPPPPIDLSLGNLPYAVFLSLSRILLAYVVCLVTSLAIGYWAANSRTAEKVLIPLIDIGQSVPVLTFLPGLVLIFLRLFPQSRVGLEITCILTLYTGMAWNLMFGFYAALKTIPRDYIETIRAFGYGRLGILLRLEIPYSMNAIVWNSMLSVAGGWFFVTVCEAFTIGDQSFRLVGLGSYMTVANEKGDVTAILAGGGAMLVILIATDFFIWNPLLRWAERFQRMEPVGEEEEEAVLNFFTKSLRLTGFVRKMRIRYAGSLYANVKGQRKITAQIPWQGVGWLVLAAMILSAVAGVVSGGRMIAGLGSEDWRTLFFGAAMTFLRVNAVILLSAILMIPLGLWLGTKPGLVKKLQPVIQVVAAFPAPMLFPTLLGFFFWAKIPLSFGSVILMMTGSMWYLLFNVISGIAGVPEKLIEVAKTTGMNTTMIIRRVYLPATFPQILTGLITAAGGAWNVSIVAELVTYHGQEHEAAGLGSYMMKAFSNGNYPGLVASVALMIVLIVVVNRFFWARLYDLAESKYRLD
jgi:NitT/TauT family transport system permease protein